MSFWRHPLRIALALLAAGVCAAVLLNLREREEAVRAAPVVRTDPGAMIETTRSDLVQTDSLGDNILVKAGRQFTYADGGLRMTDGVTVTIGARAGREAFTLQSTSATVDAGKTEVSLSGDVQLAAGSDLQARTPSATYSEADGMVRMPEPAAFERSGMLAAAEASTYDRAGDLLELSRGASVTLAGSGASGTAISAAAATVAQREGWMTFSDGVQIDSGGLEMQARQVRADMVADSSRLQALSLEGGAEVAGAASGSGQLRELAAEAIDLTYREDGDGVERARLHGGTDLAAADPATEEPAAASSRSRLALAGRTPDADGTRIDAAEMEIAFDGEDDAVGAVTARGAVVLELPAAEGDQPATPEAGGTRVDAAEMEIAFGTDGDAVGAVTARGAVVLELPAAEADQRMAAEADGTRIDAAEMEIAFGADSNAASAVTARGAVVLELPAGERSQRMTADTLNVEGLAGDEPAQAHFAGGVEYREQAQAADSVRVARAEELEATLDGGLSALAGATFRGDAVFEDGDIQGRGGLARYLLADEVMELAADEDGGEPPSVTYSRGSVRAATIRVAFVGPEIAASGGVENVLSRSAGGSDADAELPGLVDAAEVLLVTASELAYDGAEQRVAYSGGAHLWQGDVTFRGDSIELDEASGNLAIEGGAETQFALTRINRETGEAEPSLATGSGASMRYDKDTHRITYAEEARLDGPQGDLQADEIQVQLQADDVTLDRVTASGAVTLRTAGRVVSGELLVYHDADGRYEIEGQPARFVEQVDDGCRETLGRTLTFYAATADVAVDGQAQARTATASGACTEQFGN